MSSDLKAQRKALADFGLFAFRCRDLDTLLTRAAELISDAFQVDLVKVLEHRPERGDFLLRAGVNWEPGVVGHVTLADHEKSPAGFALLTNEPVVSRDIGAEDRFEISDVLVRHGVKSMINVIIVGEEKPFGVLEVDAREHCDFDDDEISFLQNYSNLLASAVERIRSHKELERHAREQSVIARELEHRVKNILGLVQALTSQTSLEGRTAQQFRDSLIGRFQALAKAESLVFQDQGETADPRQTAFDILGPYRGDRAEAITISGPSVRLSARKGRMLGLALHELATNSAKYGALSVAEGRVQVEFHVDGGEQLSRLEVRWQEFDGPSVTPPKRMGFGTRLLEKVASAEMEGAAELEYRSEGLIYRLSISLE
ncbi:Two-component sensor histidine kinase, contains HisKA and HATPase domains [Citreimonas salinaria]|uniref:histidine kinase n=1 Tax=Citreimonas salinaria TaxID=321339 RepID=A0A1H3M2M6_9RHOB|nr:Two-component sensor histidine kinase, contains HisKA and HATPase domains [Citreimonas salinaria]